MPPKSYIFVLALLLASIHAETLAQSPQVKLEFGQGVDADVKRTFETTVEFATAFFSEVFRQAKTLSATVHVYTSREELLRAYTRKYQVSRDAAERIFGQMTSALADPSQDIWMNLGAPCYKAPPTELGCRYQVSLIHELFHLWQYEFRGWPSSPVWMREGTASYAGFLGASRMAVFSTEEALQYLTDSIRRARELPRLWEVNSIDEWRAWEERSGGRHYHLAAIAAFRLGGDRPERVTEFFRTLGTHPDWRSAFGVAFGRGFDQFEAQFAQDISSVLSTRSRIGPVTSCPSIVWDGEMFRVLQLTREAFEAKQYANAKVLSECLRNSGWRGNINVRYTATMYYWASVAHGEGRYEDGYARLVAEVIGIQPTWYNGHLEAGEIALVLIGRAPQWTGRALHHLNTARGLLDSGIRRFPQARTYMVDLARVHYLLGEFHRRAGNCREAEGFYTLARSAEGTPWSRQAAQALGTLQSSCPR